MKGDILSELVVVKRSGQRVSFNGAKVAIAIKKGFDSVYEEYDEKEVNKVYEKVLKSIEKNYQDRKTIGVEEIQDIIENEGKAELICHFCNEKYVFSEEELKNLIKCYNL